MLCADLLPASEINGANFVVTQNSANELVQNNVVDSSKYNTKSDPMYLYEYKNSNSEMTGGNLNTVFVEREGLRGSRGDKVNTVRYITRGGKNVGHGSGGATGVRSSGYIVKQAGKFDSGTNVGVGDKVDRMSAGSGYGRIRNSNGKHIQKMEVISTGGQDMRSGGDGIGGRTVVSSDPSASGSVVSPSGGLNQKEVTAVSTDRLASGGVISSSGGLNPKAVSVVSSGPVRSSEVGSVGRAPVDNDTQSSNSRTTTVVHRSVSGNNSEDRASDHSSSVKKETVVVSGGAGKSSGANPSADTESKVIVDKRYEVVTKVTDDTTLQGQQSSKGIADSVMVSKGERILPERGNDKITTITSNRQNSKVLELKEHNQILGNDGVGKTVIVTGVNKLPGQDVNSIGGSIAQQNTGHVGSVSLLDDHVGRNPITAADSRERPGNISNGVAVPTDISRNPADQHAKTFSTSLTVQNGNLPQSTVADSHGKFQSQLTAVGSHRIDSSSKSIPFEFNTSVPRGMYQQFFFV